MALLRCNETVVLQSVGTHLPRERVSTASLEDRLAPLYERFNIPRGQLQSMTGIVERRFWPKEVSLAHEGAKAAQDALSRGEVPVQAIGCLIYASVCREAFEPATACMVAHHLANFGLVLPEEVELIDLSNACLGAMNAIFDLVAKIQSAQIRAGMVVLCESAREINEIAIAQMLQNSDLEHFKVSLATLTGGSGAAAIVVSDGGFGDGWGRIVGGVGKSDYQWHRLCRWEVQRRWESLPLLGKEGYSWEERMRTDSVAVLEHGLALGRRTFAAFLEHLDWTREDIACSVGHQVGRVHQQRMLETLKLDPQRDQQTFQVLGNTGSAAIALTLAQSWEEGRIQAGDRVALLGIGSGLNCVMLGVQC